MLEAGVAIRGYSRAQRHQFADGLVVEAFRRIQARPLSHFHTAGVTAHAGYLAIYEHQGQALGAMFVERCLDRGIGRKRCRALGEVVALNRNAP